MNAKIVENVLVQLAQAGVREFCVCAGNRNSPIIFALEVSKGIRIHSFVDERSAAFFAIGRIHALGGKPVAVVVTSGTAVAECAPAVIEAYYQSLPLVVLSADRPRAYRGSGAPQSIEQFGLFGLYAPVRADVDQPEDSLDLPRSGLKVPAQINVCLDEPLFSEPPIAVDFTKYDNIQAPASEPLSWTQGIQPESPLTIVGSLLPEERPLVAEFLREGYGPVWLESLSGLRGTEVARELLGQGRLILTGDRGLTQCLESGFCKSVLRLGGVPTTRVWRDLEGKFESVPVFSISHGDFTGLSRVSRHYLGFHHLTLVKERSLQSTEARSNFSERESEFHDRAELLFEKYPRSETGMLWSLQNWIGTDDLYLGNSLPVREWDLVSWKFLNQDVLGNRGANGIDGQISTFLGWSFEGSRKSWALLGDLTSIYDLNAGWISNFLPPGDRRLVIINNNGGQIFKKFSRSDRMLLPHRVRFKDWASMWGFFYEAWDEVPPRKDSSLAPTNDRLHVIELLPDPEHTERCHQELSFL